MGRGTNKKKTSVFERLHMIHGYHAYTQYDMAFVDISSEEEESSSTEDELSSEESSSDTEESEEDSLSFENESLQ